MPFFYSQYLKDERIKKGGQTSPGGGTSNGNRSQPSTTTNTKPNAKTNTAGGRRLPSSSTPRSRSFNSGRLVWHSNIGASGRRNNKTGNYKPLKYNPVTDGKKVVHFATIEIQPFHFDWSLADDVFYTRKELTAMGQSRFDDAAKLRQQHHLDEKGRERSESIDDLGTNTKSKVKDINTLLSMALDDDDRNEDVSIRGIEHFVYPDLQQEMIRRKKEVQREVLDFVRSKRPDPQGWRLAQHSRTFSQWARNVAQEKGMKYCMNSAAGDPDVGISEDELHRFKESTDELESSQRSLRGSLSFSASPSGSRSFDGDDPSSRGSRSFDGDTPSSDIVGGLEGITESDEKGDDTGEDMGDELNKSCSSEKNNEAQPAGVGTGEG